MGNVKAPSTLGTASDGLGPVSGSTPKDKGKQRLSSTGKFLHNILTRLKSPFSPTLGSPSPPTAPSPFTPTPKTATQTRLRNPGEPDMAAVPARPSTFQAQECTGLSNSLNRATAHTADADKENQPSSSVAPIPVTEMTQLSLENAAARPQSSAPMVRDTYTPSEKAIHQEFMDQALDMARLALRTNETPVGCVLVHNGAVVARGMNATNVTRNGTRHAEFMALSALLSYRRDNTKETVSTQLKEQANDAAKEDIQDDESDLFPMDDDYVRKGHLYPYGQKLHRHPRVDRSIVRECTLYVTVEPCVMCAGLLRQLGIKKVYFGAVNDKFGGTGGVFSIHKNSTGAHRHTNCTSAPKPVQYSTNASNLPRPTSSSSAKILLRETSIHNGDGGNVEPGFEAEGGWGRDEAVSLLRRFYVQENGRAPVPRKKEGRAARLAAMEAGSEAAGAAAPLSLDADASNDAGSPSIASDVAKES